MVYRGFTFPYISGMEPKQLETPQIDIQIDETTSVKLEARVVLYNDDWHSFDDVIFQLIKAIKCTFEEARGFAFEVHVKGKAIVYSGDMPGCLKVSSILEEISLFTQIIT